MPGPGKKGRRTPQPHGSVRGNPWRSPQPMQGGYQGTGAAVPWWQRAAATALNPMAPIQNLAVQAAQNLTQPAQPYNVPGWMTPLGSLNTNPGYQVQGQPFPNPGYQVQGQPFPNPGYQVQGQPYRKIRPLGAPSSDSNFYQPAWAPTPGTPYRKIQRRPKSNRPY